MASLSWNRSNESVSNSEKDGAKVQLVRGKPSHELVLVEIQDTLFLPDSCIALPANMAGDGGDSSDSPTSIGLIATALRHVQEVAGQKMLIAGHCDSSDSGSLQELSRNRAEFVKSMLIGDRETFVSLCAGQEGGQDLAAIFDWAARSYAFTCALETVDAAPSDEKYEQFRNSFNDWLDARDSSLEQDQRGETKLETSGGIDESIWGAVFDLFEFSLRAELGEDAAGVTALRDGVVWVDPEKQALGFADNFPIDTLETEKYRSQSSRRVEILFVDEGEEPDLQVATDDPAASDIFLKDVYKRDHVEARASNLCRPAFLVTVQDCQGTGISPAKVEMLKEAAVLASGSVDEAGNCELFLTSEDGLLVRVTGMDEGKLPAGEATGACAGTASELGEGIECPAGSEVVVGVMLLDVGFTLERTQIEAQPRTATLETSDGSYRVTLELSRPVDDSLAQEALFTGVPTDNKLYTLTVEEAGEAETVFSRWNYQRLIAEVDKSLRISLEEPELDMQEEGAEGENGEGQGNAAG